MRSKRPGRSSAGSRESARLVAPMRRMLENGGAAVLSCRPGGKYRFSRRFHQLAKRVGRGLSSKLCICTRSSLTTPPTPSEMAGDITRPPGTPVAIAVAVEMPPRRIPMASNSSMNPMAPPSARATLRKCRKKPRILRAVMPYHMLWNEVADTNRKGTPASLAMARATWVLPVPGGPSKSTPRRGVPPMSRWKRLWFKKTSRVWRTSATTGPSPLTSEKVTSICSGRKMVCGERALPSIGATRTMPSSRTIRMPGSQIQASDGNSGSPGETGLLVRARYHSQAASGTRKTAIRRRRLRRCRSRVAVTSMAMPLLPLFALRGHSIVTLRVRQCTISSFRSD